MSMPWRSGDDDAGLGISSVIGDEKGKVGGAGMGTFGGISKSVSISVASRDVGESRRVPGVYPAE